MKTDRNSGAREAPPRALWFTRNTLRNAFRLGGCAICHALRASERKGIHSFLYEGMMSPVVRGNFLNSGGFCLRHFWMAKEIEDETWPTGGIGLAILCEDLTRLVQAGEQKVFVGGPPQHNLFRHRSRSSAFVPGHDCMFCHDNAEKERFLSEVLEDLVEEPEFARPLASHGLCARHGQMALQLWKDPARRQRLFSLLKARTAQLAADLKEFVRKHDYQYRNEAPGQEQDSLIRAIHLLAGASDCRRDGISERP